MMLIKRCILRNLLLCSIFLVPVFFLTPVSGQATGDPHEDFLYGEYYVSQGFYQEALPFYLSALKDNPDNCNINYRIGLCYIKIIGEHYKALPYLEKAVEKIDIHYVEGRYKKPGAPVEAWLLLGDAYHRRNDLVKASYAYHEYKRLIGPTDHQAMERVIQKIEGLGISSEYQRFGQDVRLVNMGGQLNSRFSDYNPILSGDQRILIYTQFWESYDRIMVSYRTPQGWSTPESLNEKIGSEGNCYTSALSYDGTELYLIWHDELDYEIYVTYYRDGVWTGMVPVPGKVNSRSRESSVCISSGGDYLYFSSDRPGGEGGFDIYAARREGDQWDHVVNLGIKINTTANEEAPYLTCDGGTLYFSSDGYESVGNMDILYSLRNDSGSWTTPVNLGLPVNTTNDDIFYVYFPDTRSGYLARDLPNGYGKNDLYRVQTGEDPLIWPEAIVSDSVGLVLNPTAEILKDDSDLAVPDTCLLEIPTASDSVYSSADETPGTVPADSVPDSGTESGDDIGSGILLSDADSLSETKDPTGKMDTGLGFAEETYAETISDGDTGNQLQDKSGEEIGNGIGLTNTDPTGETAGPPEQIAAGVSTTEEIHTEYISDGDTGDQLQDKSGEAIGNGIVLADTDPSGEPAGPPEQIAAGVSTTEEIYTEIISDGDMEDRSQDGSGEAIGNGIVLADTDPTGESAGPPEQIAAGVSITEEIHTEDISDGDTGDRSQDGSGENDSRYAQSVMNSILSDPEKPVTSDEEAQLPDGILHEEVIFEGDDLQTVTENRHYDTSARVSFENDEEWVSGDDLTSDSIPTYTIQLYALRKRIDPSRIRLSPLVVSEGNDGLFRYTYGEYIGYSNAREILFRLRESGYPDAFIRNIAAVQNYRGNDKR